MQLVINTKNKNELLSRTEVIGKVTFDKATPSNSELAEAIAKLEVWGAASNPPKDGKHPFLDDEELQDKFWALFGPNKLRSPDLRIGAQYLRQNKDFLEI